MEEEEVGDVTQLMREIVALSAAPDWAVAKHEWSLDAIDHCRYGEYRCLCGHAISEMCWLRNRVNGNRALVGNVCVCRFVGIRSDLIFACLRRLLDDDEKAMNAETIEWAYERGWINTREMNFCTDTIHKRNLSWKQARWRRALNLRVLGFAKMRPTQIGVRKPEPVLT
jgi:hypothetical protein